jgi:hypothetical protein
MSGHKIIVNGRDWATVDIDVIGAVLDNLIREPVPLPHWTEQQLQILTSSFTELEAALPQLLDRDPELFGPVGEVAESATEILQRLLPTVAPASVDQYRRVSIDFDAMSEHLAQIISSGRPKGGVADERIEVFSRLDLGDLTRAWRRVDQWLAPVTDTSMNSNGNRIYQAAIHRAHPAHHLVTEQPHRSETRMSFLWNCRTDDPKSKATRLALTEPIRVDLLCAKQLDGVFRTDIYLSGVPKPWRKAFTDWWYAAAEQADAIVARPSA